MPLGLTLRKGRCLRNSKGLAEEVLVVAEDVAVGLATVTMAPQSSPPVNCTSKLDRVTATCSLRETNLSGSQLTRSQAIPKTLARHLPLATVLCSFDLISIFTVLHPTNTELKPNERRKDPPSMNTDFNVCSDPDGPREPFPIDTGKRASAGLLE